MPSAQRGRAGRGRSGCRIDRARWGAARCAHRDRHRAGGGWRPDRRWRGAAGSRGRRHAQSSGSAPGLGSARPGGRRQDDANAAVGHVRPGRTRRAAAEGHLGRHRCLRRARRAQGCQPVRRADLIPVSHDRPRTRAWAGSGALAAGEGRRRAVRLAEWRAGDRQVAGRSGVARYPGERTAPAAQPPMLALLLRTPLCIPSFRGCCSPPGSALATPTKRSSTSWRPSSGAAKRGGWSRPCWDRP